MFDLRVICTCDQCYSPFCALQLTALITPDWCFLLYCFACLYHSLEVLQPSWIAVPCPTTKLSLLISKSFVEIKQGMIRVALKTLLKNKVGNLYLQNITSASARRLCWFYIKLSPPHFTTKLRPWTQLRWLSRPKIITRLGSACPLSPSKKFVDVRWRMVEFVLVWYNERCEICRCWQGCFILSRARWINFLVADMLGICPWTDWPVNLTAWLRICDGNSIVSMAQCKIRRDRST